MRARPHTSCAPSAQNFARDPIAADLEHRHNRGSEKDSSRVVVTSALRGWMAVRSDKCGGPYSPGISCSRVYHVMKPRRHHAFVAGASKTDGGPDAHDRQDHQTFDRHVHALAGPRPTSLKNPMTYSNKYVT